MAGFVVMFAAYMILVARPPLDSSNFILVMISLAVIAESLRRASKVNNAMQKANAAAERIFELLDLPLEGNRRARASNNGAAVQSAAPRKLATLGSRIQFQNIVFTYPNSATPALNDVDLEVPKGQSVAIVGRNGSGKTTLLRLLSRLFEPQSGRILIDGVDICAVAIPSLREQISLVTQESVIFPGTIAQNIAYGNPLAEPDAPDSPQRRSIFQQIEDAARRAFAHEFIVDKPQGYHTPLGELGGQLSGGQKQRLCIARAIFRKSPILILDEATSQVDAESEHLIQQAIEQVMHERTTFVIAHRLGTILSADTIVVMERGRIVGQGRHDDLLRSCETYQQLYERQLVSAG
jgi:ABC-type multidrug transport system fused ATPase/permease subunit